MGTNCKGVGCSGLSNEGVKPKGVIVAWPTVGVILPPMGVLVMATVGVAFGLRGCAVPHNKKPMQ